MTEDKLNDISKLIEALVYLGVYNLEDSDFILEKYSISLVYAEDFDPDHARYSIQIFDSTEPELLPQMLAGEVNFDDENQVKTIVLRIIQECPDDIDYPDPLTRSAAQAVKLIHDTGIEPCKFGIDGQVVKWDKLPQISPDCYFFHFLDLALVEDAPVALAGDSPG